MQLGLTWTNHPYPSMTIIQGASRCYIWTLWARHWLETLDGEDQRNGLDPWLGHAACHIDAMPGSDLWLNCNGGEVSQAKKRKWRSFLILNYYSSVTGIWDINQGSLSLLQPTIFLKNPKNTYIIWTNLTTFAPFLTGLLEASLAVVYMTLVVN